MIDVAIAVVICVAVLAVSYKTPIPAIPLYIIAGIVAGNLGLKASEVSHFLSQLGIIFLLIYIGLEIKIESFIKKSKELTGIGVIDLFVTFTPILAVSVLFFDLADAVVIAAALYISSSAIVIHSLIENRRLIFPESETILWMMILEDLILIVFLFLLSAKIAAVMDFALKVVVYSAVVMLFAKTFLKYLKRLLAETEFVSIAAFSLAAIPLLVAEVGIPESLAAILIGMAFSDIKSIQRYIKPFKDVFLVLFFFFFGLSIKIEGFIHPGALIAVIIATVVGKFAAGAVIGRVLHGSLASGVEIGATTIARGEFSILVAALSGVEVVKTVVTVTVIATSLIGAVTAKYARAAGKLVQKRKIGE